MRAEVVVDNRVRVARAGLPRALEDALRREFTHRDPAYYRAKAMGRYVGNAARTIDTWGEAPGELSFPRGGLGRVRALLEAHGVGRRVVDRRCDGEVGLEAEHRPPGGGGLYEYQERGVGRLLEVENGLLRAATGSGKTTMGLALAARSGASTLVLADKQKLLEQWRDRCVSELGMRAEDVGFIGGGRFRLAPVTLALPVSVVKRLGHPRDGERIRRYFGHVLCDEVQAAGASYLWRAVDAMPARRRTGISADERRRDKKDFLVHDLFGRPCFEVDREDLVQSGHVMDVEIRVVPTGFRAPWYGRPGGDPLDGDLFGLPGGLADEAPVGEHPGERETDFNRLLDEMARDGRRNALAVDAARGEAAEGQQVLVFARRREHCHALSRALVASGLPTGFLIGGPDYSVEFDRTKAGLLSGRLRVGVGTYGALGQGIDLPRVGCGVAVTPIAANQQFFNQVRGRVCRVARGKTRARLVYLWDEHLFPDHLAKIVRWNPTVSVLSPTGAWVSGREHLRRARSASR